MLIVTNFRNTSATVSKDSKKKWIGWMDVSKRIVSSCSNTWSLFIFVIHTQAMIEFREYSIKCRWGNYIRIILLFKNAINKIKWSKTVGLMH